MKEVTCLKGEQCDGVDAKARFVIVGTVEAVWNACQIRPCIVDVHWSVSERLKAMEERLSMMCRISLLRVFGNDFPAGIGSCAVDVLSNREVGKVSTLLWSCISPYLKVQADRKSTQDC